jgi:manganese/iron transport system permease protein/iron/zinc/copper transport system permease protein
MEFFSNLITYITEPFGYTFIQRAFICALLIGGLSGLVGVFVVLRRMSYIGHGLSSSVFGGTVISYMIGVNVYLGSAVWAFLTALLVIWTGRRRRIGSDAAIGIITTAGFAIGVIIASSTHDFPGDIDAALFGNILTLTNRDLLAVVGITVALIPVIFFAYKQLLFTAFDADAASVYGVRTIWIDALFSIIVAGLIVGATQVVGVTMIAASLVTPPTIARLLTNNFHRLVIMSVLIGVFGGLVGVYASWYLNWATGATIVLTHAILFVVALLYSTVIRPRITQRGQTIPVQAAATELKTAL